MKESVKGKATINWKIGAALWLVVGVLLIGEQMRGHGGVQTSFRQEIDKQAQIDLANIKRQVADDAVEQYRMVGLSGSSMDRCVQAGMVSESFLQSQDHDEYRRWKIIEKNDCKSAGLDR
ncbi:hypothetical protein [Sphingobium sp.]|uniref:hypothetical protein n=1 Tax=Sphingobium sp. TaxID=1912891 RepID=UPI003BB7D60C